MNIILFSVLVLGGMGLIFGAGLSFAGIKFRVEEDPRLGALRAALPGANCGGCGYAGCAALAEAILAGAAPPDACPVGGGVAALAIGEIMGIPVTVKERACAFVKCGGNCEVSDFRYEYQGLNDCGAAMQLAAGGAKSCMYGCLGGGSCKAACEFDAITMVNGIAVVDNEKCTACGQCVKACPKKLIALVPYKNKIRVACNSRDNGKTVRAICKVGCIACRLCEKACEYDAVQIEEQLSKIDYQKCTQCKACVGKCPTKCILEV